jgi:hypothetical protein
MANALGRISGQLLKDNLTRNGHDLQLDTDLVYLNVNSRYIGINTDGPFRPLLVNGTTLTTNLIVDNSFTNSSTTLDPDDKITISSNEINSGTVLNLSASGYIYADRIKTDQLEINNNTIYSLDGNSIELRPIGAGSLDIYNNLNITGNLWAKETTPGTGNITLDGNITFGSTNQTGPNADTISFNADINTDIIPDLNETYSLGSLSKKWEGLYTELINGEQVTSSNIASGGIDLALLQGNIWYVATNGSDIPNPELTQGKHQNAPFASIGEALSQAVAGDTVYIYPGTYTETFPLTVPVGVTVKGTSIRSVTVQPTVPTQSNNAFLLNGESTVSDLSVVNFYAPGYAFSFAPGFTVTTRSPYVQNITVITKGSVTSPTDPRGFDEGDAGGGARVDGSLATSSSKEASMLFHSVTFITPGVDALVMTNGVRVEWLNSFSYFANRGLYATNGTLGLASLGVRFGAELRSIGSANVYGNYGAEADGASTLMYLIQHNFAYIGAGKDVTNDPSLNIAANETVEIASGKIYYQSLDNKGNFKVGDAFGVSFDTGLVTINGVSVSAGGLTSINFSAGTDETVIDATQITTGNVKFSNNLLTTLSGALNLDSSTNEIKLNADTDVTDNLNVIGNFNIDGTLTIGNAFIDIVRFEAPVEFDLRPKTDDDFTLGGPTNKRWDNVYLDTSYIGSYKLENATISTVPTNADIELRANGTGKIFVNQDNVEFDQDLTVDGTTNLGDNVATLAATVTGTIDHTGLLDRTGDTGQTGTYNQDGYLDVSSDVRIANVTFIDNTISTVTLNSNLELSAASTGKVTIPSADVQIDNNLFVTGNIQGSSVGVTTDITTDSYTNGNIEISLDHITTTVTDSDLEFRAAGTGKIYASQDSVKFDQDLTVDTITNLKTTVVDGDITHIGDYLQTGNTLQTGNRNISNTLDVTNNVYFDNINIVDNRIFTTNSNDSLELRAVGTGIVLFDDNTQFSQAALFGTLETNGLTNSGTITSDIFTNNNFVIDNNVIETTTLNGDFELTANGTGLVNIPLDPVAIDLDLTVTESSILKNTSITGLLEHTGSTGQTGNVLQTGDFDISNDLTVTGTSAFFSNVYIINNSIATTVGNSNLELRAAGTGIINIADSATFSQRLRVDGLTSTSTINSSGTVSSDVFTNGDIEINDNYITTTVGNNNLILDGNGTGGPRLEKLKFNASTLSTESNNDSIILSTPTSSVLINTATALKIPAGTTVNRSTLTQGELRFNTTDNLFRGFSTATVSFAGVYSADRLTRALAHPTNNTISFTAANTLAMTVSSTGFALNGLLVDNTLFNDSTISTTTGNTDLTLSPNGTGYVQMGDIAVASNTITNLDLTDPLVLQNTNSGYVKFSGTGGIVIPVGNNTNYPTNPETGDVRWNTDLSTAEVFNGINYQSFEGATGEVLTEAQVQEVTNLWALVLG